MPICLDPEQTIRVVLEHDAALPLAEQPALIYKAMTGRQWRQFQALLDRASQVSGIEQLDLYYEAARVNLCDWLNMNRPFKPEELDDILSPGECEELLLKTMRVMRVGPEIKKKSDLQPASDTVKSVEPVSPVNVSIAPQA